MKRRPVSIVTVTRDGLFFTRLLVERVRRTVAERDYEIIIVDQGSRDRTRQWARAQPDVRLLRHRRWLRRDHGHGEAAEAGVRAARHDHVVLLDSDAHPVSADWLECSVDRLDEAHPLAGAVYRGPHAGNPYGWYIHPHFMAFRRRDLGGLIVLRKLRGDTTDTGEEATLRVLAAGREVIAHEINRCPRFDVGLPHAPTVAGGVFHAWYISRLLHNEADVIRESGGLVSRASYLEPLQAALRKAYGVPD
jgi:glycosyltransferase involved in cell wall biosynthesis